MSGVVVGVEPDEVAMQHTEKELIADGKNAVDLTARERRVQEEADLHILSARANLLAEHLRQQHQVVVVDPDEVSVLYLLGDGLGEETVRFLVGFPGGLVERDLAGVVVKERPQDGI